MEGSLDLAIIGNCQVSGLLDADGRLVWACMPRPDADPVFCALLEPAGDAALRGVFAVELLDIVARERAYVRNTAIVATTLRDAAGAALQITDFCPRFRRRGRMFRPTTFIRLIEPLAGRPRIRIRLTPCSDYGASAPAPVIGSHHLRFRCADAAYRVTTDASLAAVVECRPFMLDAPIAIIVGPDEPLDGAPLEAARDFLAHTRQYWQEWVRTLALPFEWQDAVIRAAITLKLSSYEDTGAVLAALTTSIPEAPHTGRNWDYRFCWLRDSYFVVQALNRLGATRTMEGYLRYINNIVGHTAVDDLQPVYGITGAARLDEQVAGTLRGYRGMGPVRIGNDAYRQRQHDVYGALVLAASQLFFDARLAAPGDASLFARLERLGERAVAVADAPDSGPWELRGRIAPHSFSAAMCWAACDRLARIASRLGLADRARAWRDHAAHIAARTLAAAWCEARQSFAATLGGASLDATLLLWPELGLVSGHDQRFVATLRAIESSLLEGDLVFRYRDEDDFGAPQFAFTSCSFWYANALAASGRLDEARAVFERVLARRNSVGLLSEHIDPASGEHWGNFPQTYCMVGVISSAIRLSRPWEGAL